MSTYELPKTYDFKDTEHRIYEMWERGGYFQPHNDPNKPDFDPNVEPFVIAIPPPNVTGELHTGHAMFVSVEDLMIRYHRMKGYSTLWIPGSDHAGIATQLMVERQLMKEGTSREAVGREEFLRRTWAWKDEKGGMITRQIRRLGASCDWTRERFTLDEGLSRAVREAFVRLYEKGLIYRGPRLINWSPGLKTAVSDLEVEYSEEPGTLYYFKYMLADSKGEPMARPYTDDGPYIPVATTRPETILGDTAVAVHPEDERYQQFIGKKVIVPMLGREIPVIADEYVEREFGTGALKITPGHDPNDYEIGHRHGLEILSMLDKEAKVTEVGGPYAGLDRFECRKKLWADMKANGLVIREEPYTLNVPRSQRGGEIVEPMVSEQWFVTIEPLAEKARAAVRDGDIRIVPDYFEKVYFNWLDNIQDWCISRQLWWGHRIPVWYCAACGKQTCAARLSDRDEAREDPSACAHCGSANIQQDPDVLDTWFSSGLWPFSTLGWPEETPDLKYFYPTSYMETGADILFFWVARMIMSGLEFTGKAPFHTVYLHGLIRDEHGKKMSKTTGNVIDPLIVMDELGTDALRFTLLVGSTPGQNTNLSIKKVESNRNFANKLWNAGRFVINAITALEDGQKPGDETPNTPDWTLADSWIWARLQTLVRDVERLFQSFQYGQAGQMIYDFIWNDFADWYLEIAKQQLAQGGARARLTAETLLRVFDICLRLLHPFTPFVTEEIWGHLRRATNQSALADLVADWPEVLMIARWPEIRPAEGWEAEKIANFALMQDAIRAIRNLRSEKNVKPGLKLPAIIVDASGLMKQETHTFAALANLDYSRLSILDSLDSKPAGHVALVAGPIEIFLPLSEMVDPAEERARLEKELAEAESHINRLENLLAGDFANKAPAALVQKERDKLAVYKESAEKIKAQLG